MNLKNQNRRRFIKTSILGGLGSVALPNLVSSRVWAADTAPHSRITVGFIGMGKQSRGLLRAFLGQNTRVLAVCDVDTSRREDARKTVAAHYAQSEASGGEGVAADGCTAYHDFRELIARDDIDAVCIATPDHWHALITLAALQAGKDVYCEKPLTHNIREAMEVMRATRETGRILQTGSMQRSSSEFRVACELVRNGAIGRVKFVECSFGPPPIPCDLPEEKMEPGLDWDLWLGPAPLRPYHSILSPRGLHDHFPRWRNYIEYGGGMVTDWGAHHLDIAQWGLDMDTSGPVEVLPPESLDAKNGARLVYANGVTVKHVDGFGVDFVGTEGRVQVNRGRFVFEREGQTIAAYRGGAEDHDTNLTEQVMIAQSGYLADAKVRLYVSRNHVTDFLECVRSRKQPITNAEVGGRTVICCHLMNLAYLHHQKIRWQPDLMAFAPDSGNPKWLTRDYRTPWQV
jgi:predicted dehydrogenase